MALIPNFLMTARHAHPNVRTEADYRARQKEAIDAGKQHYPNLPWRDPWPADEQPPVFVSGGRWVVECACGNCPMVAPEWNGLALCYECGAVYEGLAMPADAPAIEQALVARRSLSERYWNPEIPVADLFAQNGVG